MIPLLISLLMLGLGAVPPPAHARSVSNNWAGYVQPGWDQMVGAEWGVPTLNCTVTPKGETADWVGVNGDKVRDSGLFQDGTISSCTNGLQRDYAWWTDEAEGYSSQWLFPVAVGDVVYARVWQERSGYWAYSVRDLTTGQSSHSAEAFNGPGLSAEWIAEDPMNRGTHKLYPLADFGVVRFSHAEYIGHTRYATAIQMYMQSGALQALTGTMAKASFDVSYESRK